MACFSFNQCRLKRIVVKYYYVLLFLLLFMSIACVFVSIYLKKIPNISDPFKFMNIYGMRSNHKLKTFQLIKENTGSNKLFSHTGYDATNLQDENMKKKNSFNNTNVSETIINCANLDNYEENDFIKFLVEFKYDANQFPSISYENLKALSQFQLEIDSSIRKSLNTDKNNSIIFVKTCSLADTANVPFNLDDSSPNYDKNVNLIRKFDENLYTCLQQQQQQSENAKANAETTMKMNKKLNCLNMEATKKLVKYYLNTASKYTIDNTNGQDNSPQHTQANVLNQTWIYVIVSERREASTVERNDQPVKPTLCENLRNMRHKLKNNQRYRVKSIELSDELRQRLECYHTSIVDAWPVLLVSFLILIILKFIYLNTISIISVMSVLSVVLVVYASTLVYGAINLEHDSSFVVLNFIPIALILVINLFDSLVWSICYTESRKNNSSSNGSVAALTSFGSNSGTNSSTSTNSNDEKSMRILSSTLNQIFYYLLPKNVAFILMFIVCYLNQIELIQLVSIYSIVLIVSYLLVSFVCYLFIISFLSKHHHKFSFSHRIKIFDIDLNKLIESFFAKFLPYLIVKLNYLWLVLFTCSSVLAFMTLFYSPKLTIDTAMLNFNLTRDDHYALSGGDTSTAKNPNFNIYIVWGLKVDQTNSNKLIDLDTKTSTSKRQKVIIDNLDRLLAIDMELKPLENFNILYRLCSDLKHLNIKLTMSTGMQGLDIVKSYNCFTSKFEKNFLKRGVDAGDRVKNRRDYQNARSLFESSTVRIHQNYCDPNVNPAVERFINRNNNNNNNGQSIRPNQSNSKEENQLFATCIKWWSLKLYLSDLIDDNGDHDDNDHDHEDEKENSTGEIVEDVTMDDFVGPLFLVNRLSPYLYVIRIETNLPLTNDFTRMQENYVKVEKWWKVLVSKYKLNEDYVWWTSDQLSNYLMQKKTNQQMLLGILVSFIIILAITVYACSNLIISFCVFVTFLQTLASVLAVTVWFGWHVNLFHFCLYLTGIVIAAQYTIISGVLYRFSPHIELKSSIQWSFTTFGSLMIAFCLICTFSSIPLVANGLDFLHKLGIILLFSNLLSYLFATLYLPSLLFVISTKLAQKLSHHSVRAMRGVNHPHERNMRNRNYLSRQISTSSFSPSNYYSHVATGSTYLESELTDIGEYRRRTLSRCNSSFNYGNQQPLVQQPGQPSNVAVVENESSLCNKAPGVHTNQLQIPSSNHLQIPRLSRASIRRSSLRNSRRLSKKFAEFPPAESIINLNKSNRRNSNQNSNVPVIQTPATTSINSNLLNIQPTHLHHHHHHHLNIQSHQQPNENLIESCISEVDK